MSEIAGPRGPIPFTRDELGYPSLEARDRLDGAFAHGWLIATDRLIQVHLSLIAAEGRLMSKVGDQPVFRTLDRWTRMLDLAGGAAEEAGKLGDPARTLIQAWCDGFNAGAARRGRGLVMRVLGEPVRRFTPEDVVTVYRLACFFGLTSMQLAGELGLTEMLAAGAPDELVRLLLGDAAGGVDAKAVVGADLSVLAAFGVPAFGGSNAAVVSAARSASGHALLWGQPHFEVARFPPVLYVIHMELAEGPDLTGMCIPGLPWMSFGRTDAVAWTYTYGHGDNIDILVERCEGGQYEAAGERRPLERREQVVQVKGAPTETWTFWDSPYGTVVGDATTEGRYPCVRWAGLRRGSSDLDAVVKLERARTVAEALDLHQGLQLISLHALIADVHGDVGYTQTGRVDQRTDGWSGAGPAAGWTRADRTPQPLPESSRPRIVPEDGLWLSANERVDGPDGTRWVTLPEPRWRKDRLTALLGPLDKIDVEALRAAMYDGHDLSAEVLLRAWQPCLDDPEFQALCAWGGRADHPERGAMLRRFHALHDELIRDLVAPLIGAEGADSFINELYLAVLFQWHLDKTLGLECPELLTTETLARILPGAWARSADRAAAKRRDLPVRTRFLNVFFEGKLPAFLGFDSKEVELPGGPVSPFQSRRTTYDGANFVFGPGMNFFVDFGQPGATYNIPGGASENRMGPGYGKGVDAWLAGEMRPLGR